MLVKLKAIHGRFSDQKGAGDRLEIAVTRRRFLIGSGSSCHMCCKSQSVSELHCELLTENESLEVRDLGSVTGTYVNNERIQENRVLSAGDHLRVGKLEFEVVLENVRPVPPEPILHPVQGDAVDELVSDLLVQADEIEREQRQHDPNARIFRPAPIPVPVAEPESTDHRKLPPRKPPGKLPPKPVIQGKDSVTAAQKALEKLFDHGKKKPDS